CVDKAHHPREQQQDGIKTNTARASAWAAKIYDHQNQRHAAKNQGADQKPGCEIIPLYVVRTGIDKVAQGSPQEQGDRSCQEHSLQGMCCKRISIVDGMGHVDRLLDNNAPSTL